jgi:hypothetical protein
VYFPQIYGTINCIYACIIIYLTGTYGAVILELPVNLRAAGRKSLTFLPSSRFRETLTAREINKPTIYQIPDKNLSRSQRMPKLLSAVMQALLAPPLRVYIHALNLLWVGGGIEIKLDT